MRHPPKVWESRWDGATHTGFLPRTQKTIHCPPNCLPERSALSGSPATGLRRWGDLGPVSAARSWGQRTRPLRGVEGPAFVFSWISKLHGCPTLGAHLSLCLGWDRTNLAAGGLVSGHDFSRAANAMRHTILRSLIPNPSSLSTRSSVPCSFFPGLSSLQSLIPGPYPSSLSSPGMFASPRNPLKTLRRFPPPSLQFISRFRRILKP